jgi:hypothetical protein
MANSPKKKKQQQYTADGVHFFESRLALQRWCAKQVPAAGLPCSSTLNPVPQIEAIATHPIASSLVEEDSGAFTDKVVVAARSSSKMRIAAASTDLILDSPKRPPTSFSDTPIDWNIRALQAAETIPIESRAAYVNAVLKGTDPKSIMLSEYESHKQFEEKTLKSLLTTGVAAPILVDGHLYVNYHIPSRTLEPPRISDISASNNANQPTFTRGDPVVFCTSEVKTLPFEILFGEVMESAAKRMGPSNIRFYSIRWYRGVRQLPSGLWSAHSFDKQTGRVYVHGVYRTNKEAARLYRLHTGYLTEQQESNSDVLRLEGLWRPRSSSPLDPLPKNVRQTPKDAMEVKFNALNFGFRSGKHSAMEHSFSAADLLPQIDGVRRIRDLPPLEQEMETSSLRQERQGSISGDATRGSRGGSRSRSKVHPRTTTDLLTPKNLKSHSLESLHSSIESSMNLDSVILSRPPTAQELLQNWQPQRTQALFKIQQGLILRAHSLFLLSDYSWRYCSFSLHSVRPGK